MRVMSGRGGQSRDGRTTPIDPSRLAEAVSGAAVGPAPRILVVVEVTG